MSQLLDTLFMKRFCLPSNDDISNYENGGPNNVPECLCGDFNHVACILKGREEKG